MNFDKYPLKWKLSDVERALAFFWTVENASELMSTEQRTAVQLAIEALEDYQEKIQAIYDEAEDVEE
jgi:hypothetical protein